MRKNLTKAILCSVICAGVYGSSFVVTEAAEQEANWTLIVENGQVTKQEGFANIEKRYAGAYDYHTDLDADAKNGSVNIINSIIHINNEDQDDYNGIYASFAKSVNANAIADNGIVKISGSKFTSESTYAKDGVYGSFVDISNLPPNTDNFKEATAKNGTVIIDDSEIYHEIAGTYAHINSGEGNNSSAKFNAINGEVRIGSNTYIKGNVLGSSTEVQSSTTYAGQGKVYIDGENITIDAGYIVGGFSKNNVGVANS